MPQMSGRELARRLAAVRPRIKVIYMSGCTENAIVHHGGARSGTKFSSKAFRTLITGAMGLPGQPRRAPPARGGSQPKRLPGQALPVPPSNDQQDLPPNAPAFGCLTTM
jgi:hypothetical protein